MYLCGLLASPAFIWFRGFMMGAADWLGSTQADRRTPAGQTHRALRTELHFP